MAVPVCWLNSLDEMIELGDCFVVRDDDGPGWYRTRDDEAVMVLAFCVSSRDGILIWRKEIWWTSNCRIN